MNSGELSVREKDSEREKLGDARRSGGRLKRQIEKFRQVVIKQEDDNWEEQSLWKERDLYDKWSEAASAVIRVLNQEKNQMNESSVVVYF